MNELDFDKLFSMEEPETLPRTKNTPEPEEPVPDTPPPPQAPPEEPAAKGRRSHLPVLLIVMLVIGFAAGIWARRAQNAADPTLPDYTAPPYTTTAPTTLPPEITEKLVSEMVYRDRDITCYAYRDPIAMDFRETETAIWDGARLSLPVGWTGMQGAFSEHIYNVWLRVELSDESRDTLRDQELTVSISTGNTAVIPYRELYSDRPNGWFFLARIDKQELVYLSIGSSTEERMVGLSPMFNDANLAFYTTEELANMVLNQSGLWNSPLPQDLSGHLLLRTLMQRDDCIDYLLRLMQQLSTSTYSRRAESILIHPALWPCLNAEQLATFYELTSVCYLTEVYSEPLKLVTQETVSGDSGTFFELNGTLWQVAPQTPPELSGTLHSELTCFIRIELLPHIRERFGENFELKLHTSINTPVLGIRPYYDDAGLAGWFVYGDIYSKTFVNISLIGYSAEKPNGVVLQNDPVEAVPIS